MQHLNFTFYIFIFLVKHCTIHITITYLRSSTSLKVSSTHHFVQHSDNQSCFAFASNHITSNSVHHLPTLPLSVIITTFIAIRMTGRTHPSAISLQLLIDTGVQSLTRPKTFGVVRLLISRCEISLFNLAIVQSEIAL